VCWLIKPYRTCCLRASIVGRFGLVVFGCATGLDEDLGEWWISSRKRIDKAFRKGFHTLLSRKKNLCIPDINHFICISSYILKLGSLSYNKIDRFKNCDQKLSLILKYVKGCKHLFFSVVLVWWLIWNERNVQVFDVEHSVKQPTQLLQIICDEGSQWVAAGYHALGDLILC
jgi:hypothetical protein